MNRIIATVLFSYWGLLTDCLVRMMMMMMRICMICPCPKHYEEFSSAYVNIRQWENIKRTTYISIGEILRYLWTEHIASLAYCWKHGPCIHIRWTVLSYTCFIPNNADIPLQKKDFSKMYCYLPNHAILVKNEDGAFIHKVYYVTIFLEILNLKGHPNPITG